PLLLLVSFNIRMVALFSSYKMEVMQHNSIPCDVLSMAAPFVYLNIISWFDVFKVCGKTMIIVFPQTLNTSNHEIILRYTNGAAIDNTSHGIELCCMTSIL